MTSSPLCTQLFSGDISLLASKVRAAILADEKAHTATAILSSSPTKDSSPKLSSATSPLSPPTRRDSNSAINIHSIVFNILQSDAKVYRKQLYTVELNKLIDRVDEETGRPVKSQADIIVMRLSDMSFVVMEMKYAGSLTSSGGDSPSFKSFSPKLTSMTKKGSTSSSTASSTTNSSTASPSLSPSMRKYSHVSYRLDSVNECVTEDPLSVGAGIGSATPSCSASNSATSSGQNSANNSGLNTSNSKESSTNGSNTPNGNFVQRKVSHIESRTSSASAAEWLKATLQSVEDQLARPLFSSLQKKYTNYTVASGTSFVYVLHFQKKGVCTYISSKSERWAQQGVSNSVNGNVSTSISSAPSSANNSTNGTPGNNSPRNATEEHSPSNASTDSDD